MNEFALRRPGLSASLIGIGFFVFLLLLSSRHVELFDEGIILTNALRVLGGEVIHRDFYTNYGPGSPYLLAALFAVLGENLMVARVFGLVAMAAPAGLVLYILLRQASPIWAIIGATAAAMVIYAAPFYLYPVWPCLTLILMSSAVLQGERAWQRAGALLLAGALAGVTALFRYDTGFFLLLSQCLFAATMTLHDSRWTAAFRPVLLLGIGAGAAFAPFALWFLAQAPVAAFWTDIVELSRPYAPYRGLPFPGLAAIIDRPGQAVIYLPFAAGLAALADWLTKPKPRRLNAGVLLLALLTVIMSYKGMVRTSVVHMMLAIVPAIALSACLAATWWEQRGRDRLAGAMLLGFAFLGPAALGGPRLLTLEEDFGWTLAGGLIMPGQPVDPCLPGKPPLLGLMSPDHLRISAFLRREVPAGERILVALDRHDKVFVNSPTLYFTSGHLPATRMAQFDPGVQTTAPIQREIIADLVAHDTRWIVRDASFAGVSEPNLSAISSGVFLLDRHIAAHFRLVAASGPVEVWLRNDAAAPALAQESCLGTSRQTG